MSITLYGESHWDSPYVFTAFVALTEKGIPFETKVLDLQKGEQRAEAYRASLTARVPSIEHDGFWLSESQAIVEYLEEIFPEPRLLPRDERERARARQILAWIRSDLLALRQERPTTTMFWKPATTPLSKAGEAAARKLIDVASALVPDARTQLFAEWSIADADLAFVLHRLLLNGHDVPAKLRAFAETQWRRPSVRAFVDRPRPAEPPS